MQRRMRHILITLATLTILVCGLLQGVMFYAGSHRGGTRISAVINRLIPGSLAWETIELHPFSSRIVVSGARLLGPEQENIAGFQRLEIDWAWLALLKGRLQFTAIRLDNPRVDLEVMPDGALNIARAFSSPSNKEEAPEDETSSFFLPFYIRIESLEINGGRFMFQEQTAGLNLGLSDIRVYVSGDLREQSASARIRTGAGHVSLDGMRFPLTQLDAEAVLANGNIDPLRIRMDMNSSWAELTGAISGLMNAPGMDLTLRTGVVLDELGRWTDLGVRMEGEVIGHATAKGLWPEPEIKARLDLENGAVHGQKIQKALVRARMVDRRIRIHPVTVVSAGGRLSMGADVDVTAWFDKTRTDPISYNAHLDLKGIDFQKLTLLDGHVGGAGKLSLTVQGHGIDLATLDISGRLRVQGDDLVLPGVDRTVDADVSAGLAVKEGLLRADGLALNVDGVHASGNGSIGLETGTLNAGIVIEADGAELFRNFGVSGSGGRIRIQAEGGGEFLRPDATASVTATRLRIADMAFGDLNARVSIDRNGVGRVRDLTLRNGTSRLKADGSIRLRPASLNPVAELSMRLDAARLQDFFGDIGLAGELTGDIRARGPIRSPTVRLNLTSRNLGFETGSGRLAVFQDGGINADLDADGWLTVSTLHLASGDGGLSLLGKIRPIREWRLDDRIPVEAILDIHGVDLGNLLGANVAGRVHGHARLGETLINPDVDLNIRAEDIRAGDIDFGRLSMAAHVCNGLLEIDRCTLTRNTSELRLSGTARMDAWGRTEQPFLSDLALTVQGEDVRIEDFHDQAVGRLLVSARLEGTSPSLSGHARLKAEDVSIRGRFIGDLSMESFLENATLRIDPIVIRPAGHGEIEGSGWIAEDRSFAFHVSSSKIDVNAFRSFHPLRITDGRLEMDVEGKGTLDDPDIRGELRLTDIRAGDAHLAEGLIHARLAGQTAEVDVVFEPVRIQGRMNLTDSTVSGSLDCLDADLAPYFAVAGWDEWSGRLSISAELAGRLDRPQRMTGHVLTQDLALAYRNHPVIRTQDAEVRVLEDRVEATPIRMVVGHEGELTVQAGGTAMDDLDISLQGKVPLRIASLFLDEPEDIAGDLILKVAMKGSPADPEIQADMTVSDAGCTVPYLMQTLRGINGRIRLTHQELKLEEMKGRLDGGQFTLSGKMELDDFRPIGLDLNAEGTSLPLRIPDTMDMTVNVRLHMAGAPDASFVRGEAVILDGTYYRDFKINPLRDIVQPKREEIEINDPIYLPFLRNLAMDVAFTRRAPFRIENNLAELMISPDIQIAGTLNRALIRGRTSVDSGTFFYSKREFIVEKGVIDFINPYKIEPFLDIRGKVMVRNWTIHLEMSGPPDEISFRLSSEPPEEDADILSLLVFGKTGRELTMGDGQAPKSAGEMLIDLVISSRLGEDLKTATGLDILEVRKGAHGGNANGDDAGDPFSVIVGKELSRRMTIKYALESLKGEIHQRAIAEYAFFDNILVNGFQDSSGNFGGEMKFRLEFR